MKLAWRSAGLELSRCLLKIMHPSRLKSGQMCVEDIDNIPFVVQLVNDPDEGTYTIIRESVPRHNYSSCSL